MNDFSVVIPLPYIQHTRSDFLEAIDEEIEKRLTDQREVSLKSVVEQRLIRYVLHYPTVYIVYYRRPLSDDNEGRYIVYVGETNNIIDRTQQHIDKVPNKSEGWKELIDMVRKQSTDVKQYVIGCEYFNKSLTLDIENRFMSYMLGVPAVTLNLNERTNPQGDYYTADKLDKVFSDIWAKLHKNNRELFPLESLIRNSVLFKASSFTKLNV